MFGFGKALDILLDGDPVRRHEWPPDIAIVLALAHMTPSSSWLRERGFGLVLEEPELMIIETPQDGAVSRAWSPRTADLMAEDWEHVE